MSRVCVVDYHTEKVLLDELVKPVKPILDYLTRCVSLSPPKFLYLTFELKAGLVQLFRYNRRTSQQSQQPFL